MSGRAVTPIRALQLGVGLFVGVVGPVGARGCARLPGPSTTTRVAAPLSWRASVDHHFSERGPPAPLRLGPLEVGELTSGCTGFYGPAIRLRERFLQLPPQLETREASFGAMTSEGEERLVLAFQSRETVELIETRNGGLAFVHLASVAVPYGSRVRRVAAAHDFLELDLEVEPQGEALNAAVSFALGRDPAELQLSSFDRGMHFSSSLGDWIVAALP
jgi:hypothetical protein